MTEPNFWHDSSNNWYYCNVEGFKPLHFFAAIGDFELYDDYSQDILGLTSIKDYLDEAGNSTIHYRLFFFRRFTYWDLISIHSNFEPLVSLFML